MAQIIQKKIGFTAKPMLPLNCLIVTCTCRYTYYVSFTVIRHVHITCTCVHVHIICTSMYTCCHNYVYVTLYTHMCIPVSCCDFNGCKDLLFTGEVLYERTIYSVQSTLTGNLAHCINATVDGLGVEVGILTCSLYMSQK